MQLYKITESMKEVQAMVDDGVPLDQLEDTMQLIEMDFKEKAESILFVLANIKSEVEACKVEEVRLADRRKAKEKQAEKLKEYLLYNMQELKSGKIDNGVMTANIRKGASVLVITNEDAIPNKYKKIAVTSSTDKKELLKALKALEDGKIIEGAEIGAGKNTLTIK